MVSVRVCPRCGRSLPLEDFPVDRSKASGRKSWCRSCDNAKSHAYYAANRETVLEKAAARRGRVPAAAVSCSECDAPLEGRQRVMCGARRCREARFRRLNPEAYAAREAAKFVRRRERRRALRKGEA